jgi:hypothetical protein
MWTSCQILLPRRNGASMVKAELCLARQPETLLISQSDISEAIYVILDARSFTWGDFKNETHNVATLQGPARPAA